MKVCSLFGKWGQPVGRRKRQRRTLVLGLEPLEERTVLSLFAAVLPLSSLDGRQGFTVNSAADLDFLGSAVSKAGDVNGDGFDDVIIGAPGISPAAGQAYVLFGGSEFTLALNAASLNGINGFAIRGIADGDQAGASVAGVGDVNGDGIDDLAVGASAAAGGGTDRGQTYVIFGRRGGFPPVIDVATLDGTAGFVINGVANTDMSGLPVAGAGDVNDDGFDDILIGAPQANAGGTRRGQCYVVFGHGGNFPATFNLSSLNGGNGFTVSGLENDDFLGAVAGAGDVNDDGIDDIVLGAFGANLGGTNRGRAYVLFGRNTGFPATINLDMINGVGFKIDGIGDNDLLGGAVAGAGDVNNDGIDDLVVGALAANPGGIDCGQAYVIFGRSTPFPNILSAGSLDGTNGFILNGATDGDLAGGSVAAAGDVNRDGIDDLIVGAYGANVGGDDRGQGYVVFGRSTGFAAVTNLGSLDGTNGFALDGVADFDQAGWSLSGAGDLNGDGVDDLILGARNAGGLGRGASYVVFGRANLIAVGPDKGGGPQVQVFHAEGSLRFSLFPYSDTFGGGVRVAVGDINGDGQPDVITGPGSGLYARIVAFDGRTGQRLHFGRSDGFVAYPPNFLGGVYVAAGDINGDGDAEIIVAPSKGARPVRAFDGKGLRLLSFFPFGSAYAGGIKVAAGDVAVGPEDEIVTVRQTGAAQVRIFDGTGLPLGAPFSAFPGAGASVTVGNVNGLGKAEIIVGAGRGQPGTVKLFTALGTTVDDFTPLVGFLGGVRVAAVDLNGDGRADIVTAPGKGAAARVQIAEGDTLLVMNSFLSFEDDYLGGIFVAVS